MPTNGDCTVGEQVSPKVVRLFDRPVPSSKPSRPGTGRDLGPYTVFDTGSGAPALVKRAPPALIIGLVGIYAVILADLFHRVLH